MSVFRMFPLTRSLKVNSTICGVSIGLSPPGILQLSQQQRGNSHAQSHKSKLASPTPISPANVNARSGSDAILIHASTRQRSRLRWCSAVADWSKTQALLLEIFGICWPMGGLAKTQGLRLFNAILHRLDGVRCVLLYSNTHFLRRSVILSIPQNLEFSYSSNIPQQLECMAICRDCNQLQLSSGRWLNSRVYTRCCVRHSRLGFRSLFPCRILSSHSELNGECIAHVTFSVFESFEQQLSWLFRSETFEKTLQQLRERTLRVPVLSQLVWAWAVQDHTKLRQVLFTVSHIDEHTRSYCILMCKKVSSAIPAIAR